MRLAGSHSFCLAHLHTSKTTIDSKSKSYSSLYRRRPPIGRPFFVGHVPSKQIRTRKRRDFMRTIFRTRRYVSAGPRQAARPVLPKDSVCCRRTCDAFSCGECDRCSRPFCQDHMVRTSCGQLCKRCATWRRRGYWPKLCKKRHQVTSPPENSSSHLFQTRRPQMSAGAWE